MNGFQPFWGLTVLPPVVFLAKWGSYVSKKMLEILSPIPWHSGCLMTEFPFHGTQSISVLLWFPVLKQRIVVDIFYESISQPIFYLCLYLFPRLRNGWICIALVFLSFRPMQRVSEIQLIFESLPTWWKNKMPRFWGVWFQLLNSFGVQQSAARRINLSTWCSWGHHRVVSISLQAIKGDEWRWTFEIICILYGCTIVLSLLAKKRKRIVLVKRQSADPGWVLSSCSPVHP